MRRLDWNRISFVFLVVGFSGLYIAGKIWPGPTPEQFEQRRQQEYHALDEAEAKCEAELNTTLGEDFDDCVTYRMKVYHRQAKRMKEAEKELEQYRKEHPEAR